MSRKQIVIAAAAAILVSILGAMIAYRRGAERRLRPAFSSSRQREDDGDLPAPSGCVDIRSAADHTGENGCVSGRVLRVYTSRSGTTFLDFCQDYRSCPFSTVIFSSDRNNFGNLGALEGKKVDVLGEIVTSGGRADILIHGPDQIRASR